VTHLEDLMKLDLLKLYDSDYQGVHPVRTRKGALWIFRIGSWDSLFCSGINFTPSQSHRFAV